MTTGIADARPVDELRGAIAERGVRLRDNLALVGVRLDAGRIGGHSDMVLDLIHRRRDVGRLQDALKRALAVVAHPDGTGLFGLVKVLHCPPLLLHGAAKDRVALRWKVHEHEIHVVEAQSGQVAFQVLHGICVRCLGKHLRRNFGGEEVRRAVVRRQSFANGLLILVVKCSVYVVKPQRHAEGHCLLCNSWRVLPRAQTDHRHDHTIVELHVGDAA